MNKLMVIFLILFLSGCSLIFYREPYTLNRYADWVNANTNESVSNDDFGFCYSKAKSEVMGRPVNEDEDIGGLDNYYKTYPILGKCLYEKGYRFKVKHFIVYCYNKPRECKAYRNYMKLDFDTEW
ncbi:hypothetical protein FWK45_02325 [Histophilus somni]|uniref:Uncharacterized protein n=1 Tax=Histophilus somni TaxID=731 RepID=A0A9Q6K6Z5_HISSO|nr:hypothetical protein [Histophilus somni]ARU64414.1 hypothetical protein BTV18_02290 [Histophilus somni]ARU66202.1 hypothetical protein BTV19_02285 [Histophilus somni]ARU68075.1 hypothetical protein BTV16_02290 [Histophilus somni]ARU69956.1 hypothetical protein BTV20_02290 [Histophilus somni]ARU71831.1 hypothetical protein BTV17_02285 [Histophilus somni]